MKAVPQLCISSSSNIYNTSVTTAKNSFYSDVANKNYDALQGSFNAFSAMVGDSNLTDIEKFVEIAKANSAVGNLSEPVLKFPLETVASNTTLILEELKTIGENTNTEVSQNFGIDNVSSVDEMKRGVSSIVKEYFGVETDIYSFMKRSLDTDTFVQQTNETKVAWHGYQRSLDLFNKNTTSDIESNYASIGSIRRELEALKREFKASNLLTEKLLKAQEDSNDIARETANNTKEKVL